MTMLIICCSLGFKIGPWVYWRKFWILAPYGLPAQKPLVCQSEMIGSTPVAVSYATLGAVQCLMTSHAACLFWLLFDMTQSPALPSITSAFGPAGYLATSHLKVTGGLL